MQVRQFLRKGELALVIFTTGGRLHIDPVSHAGSTGNWDLNPERAAGVQRVFLYHRHGDPETNDLYVATFTGTEPSEEPDEKGRHRVTFEHAQFVGTTDADWYDFAGKGQNPVRYVS